MQMSVRMAHAILTDTLLRDMEDILMTTVNDALCVEKHKQIDEHLAQHDDHFIRLDDKVNTLEVNSTKSEVAMFAILLRRRGRRAIPDHPGPVNVVGQALAVN
jgi:hypothetical protein